MPEVEEACGLAIKLGPRIGVADELVFAAAERTHYRKRCTSFVADVIGGTGAGDPDHKLVWLSPRDALARLRHGSQRWAVAEACGLTDLLNTDQAIPEIASMVECLPRRRGTGF